LLDPIEPKETKMQETRQNELMIEIEELEAKIAPDSSASFLD